MGPRAVADRGRSPESEGMIATHTPTAPCAHCADLEERIVWLEGELGWRQDRLRFLVLRDAFGLTPREAAILELLYGANGKPVPRHRLTNAGRAEGDEGDWGDPDNLLNIYVTRLRKRLGHDAIVTLRASGYALSLKGLALVGGALG